ncbi:zinc-binding dehydrogenase [Francisella tularensis]|uniref:zinc-binding dehydrogenase n=1 Tax=Francisella tularensis TaxID=263 RepID=UPI001C0EC98B|nr:zinc-binding dehydrogenase [Francisella tularensis]MBK2109412.1 zinc-binding dehydrogenase [Francisella tularensis subsp. novicida FSC595]
MKAISYNDKNDIFEYIEKEVPKLDKNLDVLVKVIAVGLNPVDAKINQWASMRKEPLSQWVCGLDVYGEIVEIGKEVSGWHRGDLVLYHGDMMRANGGFAEYAIQDSRTIIKASSSLTAVEQASIPCAGWTAYRAMIEKLNISKDDNVFISGGSGGVGSFAVQLAKNAGAKHIITSCSEKNFEYVKSLGATHVINYNDKNLIEKVIDYTDGYGIDKLLNTSGRSTDITLSDLLAFNGHFLELLDVVRPTEYKDVFMRNLSFHQLSLGAAHRYGGDKAKNQLKEVGKNMLTLIENGSIKLPLINIVSIQDMPKVLKEMREAHTKGKYVLVL